MAKKLEKDTKFILYQVLYIIIISVMVYKGAELNLRKVTESDASEIVPRSDVEKVILERDRIKDSIKVLIEKAIFLASDEQVAKIADILKIKQIPVLKKELLDKETELAAIRQKITLNAGVVEGPAKSSFNPFRSKLFFENMQIYQMAKNSIKNPSDSITIKLVDLDNPSKVISEIPPNAETEIMIHHESKILASYLGYKDTISTMPLPPIDGKQTFVLDTRTLIQTIGKKSIMEFRYTYPKVKQLKFKVWTDPKYQDKWDYVADSEIISGENEVTLKISLSEGLLNSENGFKYFSQKFEEDYFSDEKNRYFINVHIGCEDVISGQEAKAFSVPFYFKSFN